MWTGSTYYRILLSVFLTILANTEVFAQDNVCYVGETETFYVDNHQGSEYDWSVYNEPTFSIIANNAEVSLPNGNAGNRVNVSWKKPGLYYLAVIETDITGCTNTKAFVVNVLPNNNTVAFEANTSNSCFRPGNNSFLLQLIATGTNGAPLENQYFPLNVNFKVNGNTHSSTVDFNNQQLVVENRWLDVGPGILSEVIVEIFEVTDVNGIPIVLTDSIHNHTIFSLPEIEFENELPDTIALFSNHIFSVISGSNNTYSWWFEDSSGERTDFVSTSSSTENYFWDVEGEYNLYVYATNENGCVSETISKSFVVKADENKIPSLIALPDINVGYENTLITGDVSTNDFDFLEHNRNFVFSVVGDIPTGLVFFDDGGYEYQPPQDFTGKISFNYSVCIDGTATCEETNVEIRVLSNTSSENIAPVASTDVALTLPNQTVFSNLLVNDVDPDGFGVPLNVSGQPIIDPANGVVSIENDGGFAYTPNPGFTGIDRFLYRACDTGQPAMCDSAWAYIIVSEFGNDVQKPISASDDMFLYVENGQYSLRENDFGILGENLVYSTTPVIDVSHGELNLYPDGTFRYSANEGYLGVDWFVYNVCNSDQDPTCRQGTGFILITPGLQIVNLAGNDTIVGNCESYMLNAFDLGEDFTYMWEPAEMLNDPGIANPEFYPETSTLFKLTISNNYGFKAQDSVQINVAPVIAEAGMDVSMYPGDQTILDGSKSTGADIQYKWSTQNGRIESGENTANPIVNDFGTYLLQVTDRFGCTDFDSVTVSRLANAPVAQDDYDTTNYQTIIEIDVLENDYDPDNDINSSTLTIVDEPFNGIALVNTFEFTVTYTPNDGFSGTDNFEYQICDSTSNCDRATVFVMVSDFRFFVPEAFSPNGDGINDYFEILGIEFYPGNSLEIYNRWGNRVYQAFDYGINSSPVFWDGKANTGFTLGNDELPSGTYFYVLNLGNGEKRIVGSVYLDR